MSKEVLDLFFESLMMDTALQQTLMKIDTFEKFSELAQKVGAERGYIFSVEEMEVYIKREMFPTSMVEKEADSESWLETAKPWLQFISKLKWARGKNSQVWARFIN